MNSFLNHGQTQGDAWREKEVKGELVGGNEKRKGWQERPERGHGQKLALDRWNGEVQREGGEKRLRQAFTEQQKN